MLQKIVVLVIGGWDKLQEAKRGIWRRSDKEAYRKNYRAVQPIREEIT